MDTVKYCVGTTELCVVTTPLCTRGGVLSVKEQVRKMYYLKCLVQGEVGSSSPTSIPSLCILSTWQMGQTFLALENGL